MNTFDAMICKAIKKMAVKQAPPAELRARLLDLASQRSSTHPKQAWKDFHVKLFWKIPQRYAAFKRPSSTYQGNEWYHGLVDLGLVCSLTTHTLNLSMIR
jgi:hypothetical protein